jgi:hypothetical protein
MNIELKRKIFLSSKERGVNISKVSVYYALQQKGIDTHLIGMEEKVSSLILNSIFILLSKYFYLT